MWGQYYFIVISCHFAALFSFFKLNLMWRWSSCFIRRGGRDWDDVMPSRRKPPFILSHFFTSFSSYNSFIVTLNTFFLKNTKITCKIIYILISKKVHCIYIVAKAPFPWVISWYLNLAIIAVMLLRNTSKALRPKLISSILFFFHFVK